MSAGIRFIMVAAVAASLMLPVAALAFNPQPDPPGKRQKQDQSLGGLDTKAAGSVFTRQDTTAAKPFKAAEM